MVTCTASGYTSTAVGLVGSSTTSLCGTSSSYTTGCTVTYSCCYTNYCNTCSSQGCTDTGSDSGGNSNGNRNAAREPFPFLPTMLMNIIIFLVIRLFSTPQHKWKDSSQYNISIQTFASVLHFILSLSINVDISKRQPKRLSNFLKIWGCDNCDFHPQKVRSQSAVTSFKLPQLETALMQR